MFKQAGPMQSIKSELRKWASSQRTWAKAQHRQATGHSVPEADLLTLERMEEAWIRAWSKDSETGQAAKIIINMCTEYLFLCYAIAYDMRSSAETLSSSMTQAVHDMADQQSAKLSKGKKVQLSKLLAKLRTMQPAWQQQAHDRREQLDRQQRQRRKEEGQMKLNANMEKAFAHRVASPGFSNAQQANARSNGVC